MTIDRSFRDKLLAVEPIAPEIRTQIQQEIDAMLTKELTTSRRIIFTVVTVFAFCSMCLCGFLALTEPDLPTIARTGLGVGSLFGLAWIISFVRILRRGTIDVKTDGRRTAQMVWCFTLLMVIFFVIMGMTATDSVQGMLVIGQSLVFLIGAAVYWLSYRIEEAELNVKEHLLRLELQIAEAAEKR